MTTAEIIYPFQFSFLDYPSNAEGALSVYMTGCQHNCMECSNKKLQRTGQKNGLKVTPQELWVLLRQEAGRYNDTRKVTLLGGDPLWKDNAEFTRQFLAYNDTLFDNFAVCVYTGYTKAQIEEMRWGAKLLEEKKFAYLKTGKYIYNKKVMPQKTDSHMQFGSTNQILYDDRLVAVSLDGRFEFGK